LSPIYRSPFRDLGYDVADFTDVDPRLGTLDTLDELIAEAHRRGHGGTGSGLLCGLTWR
jgi:alpha-glucosidase